MKFNFTKESNQKTKLATKEEEAKRKNEETKKRRNDKKSKQETQQNVKQKERKTKLLDFASKNRMGNKTKTTLPDFRSLEAHSYLKAKF
jgi:sRNA-binding protein